MVLALLILTGVILLVAGHLAADFFAYAGMPGPGTVSITGDRQAVLGPITWYLLKGIILDTGASDAGNTPTTELRAGLLLGQLTSNSYYQHYQPNGTNGAQLVQGALWEPRRTIDTDGNSVNRPAQIVVAGYMKASQILLLDDQARRQCQGRLMFDDRLIPPLGGYTDVIPKTANYTVVAGGLNTPGDNNRHFTTTGNAGAITFTLPAVAKGNRFRFSNTVNQNMTITAPANTLVAFNNATATNIAVTTAGQLIGATIEIVADETGAKWIALVLSPNAVTIS